MVVEGFSEHALEPDNHSGQVILQHHVRMVISKLTGWLYRKIILASIEPFVTFKAT